MEKYTIRVKANNPEYGFDDKLEKGVDTNGFLLMTGEDGACETFAVCGMSILDLAFMLFRMRDEDKSVLNQAIAISKGMEEAQKIAMGSDKRSNGKALLNALKKLHDLTEEE